MGTEDMAFVSVPFLHVVMLYVFSGADGVACVADGVTGGGFNRRAGTDVIYFRVAAAGVLDSGVADCFGGGVNWCLRYGDGQS